MTGFDLRRRLSPSSCIEDTLRGKGDEIVYVALRYAEAVEDCLRPLSCKKQKTP